MFFYSVVVVVRITNKIRISYTLHFSPAEFCRNAAAADGYCQYNVCTCVYRRRVICRVLLSLKFDTMT